MSLLWKGQLIYITINKLWDKSPVLKIVRPQAKAWGKCLFNNRYSDTITPAFRSGIVQKHIYIGVLTPFWSELIYKIENKLN